ncbi:P-loop containing nucleoside triphosphate hydrolase protein [Cylindrobasidium torrendii FP15055 ss-10]|uniref:p-loop containing nucleoside triphosphate hydrolase protein n=1 Tax=Cylindrobasidium torrendii FP15055 ss-10 TaxID=1314674 RepID=A0A0D7BUP7_9AGAR|nr:P-loop containing nucleoside triphosphate hydrolase protein [Cylindrobasidium torrendii FP15055 ss-10]
MVGHRPPPPRLEEMTQMPATRSYQQEMLDDSLQRNIIIAMDTGSGKTHIAVLRLRHEVERELTKVSWFLAPTVALCEQQYGVIKSSIPVSVGMISGALEPDQWKDARLWQSVLQTHRVVVSTPQVLLDAMRHSYVGMGRDISLIVFDEAHHAVDKAPYNTIMKEFYFRLSPRINADVVDPSLLRPHIMGLTASPVYGGDIAKSLRIIEGNLDCTIRTPYLNREELKKHVHRPTFKYAIYHAPPRDTPDAPFSSNLASLHNVLENLSVDDDPWVKETRLKLGRMKPQSSEYVRLDQRISKVVRNKDTFTLRGLRDFEQAAEAVLYELGAWSADWYIVTVLDQAKDACKSMGSMPSWHKKEKQHLLTILNAIPATPISYHEDDIADDISNKVVALIQALVNEKEDAEENNETFSGLVFVQRRDVVLSLAELLANHPVTKHTFNVGTLLGTSQSGKRHSFLDITRKLLRQPNETTLSDFRCGDKNLIVATSVAEEGIDVQACGCVIRWDPPPNMVSWLQSRGRARKKRSTFTVMVQNGSTTEEDVGKWEQMANQVADLANQIDRVGETNEPDVEEEDLEYREPSTGALLTLDSAMPHLAHFVAVHPNSSLNPDFKPLYDLDPPEFPDGWHSFDPRHPVQPSEGPWKATVTLPKFLHAENRTFTTEIAYPRKIYAMRRVAFDAYKKLRELELLDDHLLPLFFVSADVEKLMSDVQQRVGLVKVAPQVNPWVPYSAMDAWYRYELHIDNLPPLFMFLRSSVPRAWLEDGGPPVLHVPLEGDVHIRILEAGRTPVHDEQITAAKIYTRQLFWHLHGPRMKWEELDFAYLFLATQEEPVWDDRRRWLDQEQRSEGRPATWHCFDANARKFENAFGHPDDIVMVKTGFASSKGYRFVSWRYEPLNEEETEATIERHCKFKDFEGITYPLIVAEVLPSRTNLLLPLPPPSASPPAPPRRFFMLPEFASVSLISANEAHYLYYIPSIVRALGIALTTESLRHTLFINTPLFDISSNLLATAMTASMAQEPTSYERLETLGDCALKYLATIQLLGEYPLWHEGYLSRRKDHAVSNARLADENMSRKLYQWIIRDRFIGKKWVPAYQDVPALPSASPTPTPDGVEQGPPPTPPTQAEQKARRKKKVAGELSTKILADVIESTMGAAFIHGGMDLAYECAKFYDMEIKWAPVPERLNQMLARVITTEDNLQDTFPQTTIQAVESMLGYVFTHKLLLLEALSHGSLQQDYGTVSYERMELLGDAVLDMIVTNHLFHAPGKNYSPGHLHIRKSAAVNGHFLAYLCLRTRASVASYMPAPVLNPDSDRIDGVQIQTETNEVHLFNCLLHSNSHVLDQQQMSFAFFKKLDAEINDALTNSKFYPWAALTKLQAPKFLSDMVESIIGAVFLDSGGDLDTVRSVITRLGVTQLLDRIINDDFDVLHPVSRLSVWASKNQKKVEYEYVKEKGNITCIVSLSGEELVEARVTDIYRGKVTETEVRFQAAEAAIKALDVQYTA